MLCPVEQVLDLQGRVPRDLEISFVALPRTLINLDTIICCVPLQTVQTLDERGGVARHTLWVPLPPPTIAPDGEELPDLEPSAWDLLPASSRLVLVVEYLRATHRYCLFCGAQVGA
jgi:hypothetical protein